MIQKVLAATINWDHPQKGFFAAMRSMFPRVIDFDFLQLERQRQSRTQINHNFLQVVAQEKPDWIWLQIQHTETLTPETMLQVRQQHPTIVISHWMGDCDCWGSQNDFSETGFSPSLAAMGKATHLTLVSNVGQLDKYRAAGAVDARYCQIGLDWEEDVLGLPNWAPSFRVPQVVFLGNLTSPKHYPGSVQRLAMAQALRDAKVDFGVVGGNWPKDMTAGSCGVKQQHHVWKRAKVGVSANHHNFIELYYSDRQIISMASGTPLVCHYVPGLEKEFEEGRDLLWFRSPEECVDKVRWLLAHPQEAARIGKAGRAKVLAEHSWWNRIAMVLPWVEEIQERLAHR
jgi:hypothetical protein